MARDADRAGTTVELIEQQLEALERASSTNRPRWPWLLIVVGATIGLGLGLHAYSALATIDGINVRSKIDTPNPIVLFQDLATNGPRVPATVEASSRNTYSRALSQFVLDGTGVCVAVTLAVAGLFGRANQQISR
jgi:hypothetical protein